MSELFKEIKNGRMLKNNGSWLYCDKCNKTVGYLCYSGYQNFRFNFTCKCGNKGLFRLVNESENAPINANEKLKVVKNRLCCPSDDFPLFSIVYKHIDEFDYTVTCRKCMTEYNGVDK